MVSKGSKQNGSKLREIGGLRGPVRWVPLFGIVFVNQLRVKLIPFLTNWTQSL